MGPLGPAQYDEKMMGGPFKPSVGLSGIRGCLGGCFSTELAAIPKTPNLRTALDQLSLQRAKRRLLRASSRPEEQRDHAFQRMILAIPAGKVSTYGKVAAAAGYPLYHRAVARLLRTNLPDQLPWHRVLGAGGEIKLHGEAAREQRARLKMEGVTFKGKKVDMDRSEHAFKPWEVYSADDRTTRRAELPWDES